MDLSTVLGLFSGLTMIIISIFANEGSISIFTDWSSYLLVLGGTLAATCVNYPFNTVWNSIKAVKYAFTQVTLEGLDLINEIVRLGELKRTTGVFGLENQMNKIHDSFLKSGIELALSENKSDHLESQLRLELANMEKRHRIAHEIFYQMGNYAPAFGLIGTIIGLIIMFQGNTLISGESISLGASFSEKYFVLLQGMGLALKTTLYGIVISNLLFFPIAGKLKSRTEETLWYREITIEGVLSIHRGDHPVKIREKLDAFIPEQDRIL